MSAPVEKKKGPLAAFAPFPKPFWTINTVELFERGAYYGMLSVLAVFLARDLQFPAALTGALLAIQFPLLYFLPVFSGALAEKVGFKRLLIATFAFLIAGYLVLSIATNFWIGLAGITLFGIGAGLFKPMPAATVSDTTSPEDRNFGFAIYYWMINLGAFLAPLAMQQVFGGQLRSYFVVAAGLSVLNLVICLFMWKDVRPANPAIKVGATVRGLREILHHPRFMVLLAIYCGFWFMYAITTSFLQIFAVDYGILSLAQVALLVPANALAILIVGPILSKLTGKLPSLPLMIAGITIFSLGFLLVGFIPAMAPLLTALAIPMVAILLAAVFIYSIGEFLTHPSYLSYVTKISPPEKVPVFLGYGFIPIGIGQLLGTLSGGFLYGSFAEGTTARPLMFWVAIVSVGMLTVAALLVYNFYLQPRRAIAPGPGEARRRGFGGIGTFALAILAILMVPALLSAASAFPPSQPIESASADGDGLDAASLVTVALADQTGTLAEAESVTLDFTFPADATGAATFLLTWTDEAAASALHTNTPDTFRLRVTAPDGSVTESDESDTGSLEFALPDGAPGEYLVEVTLVRAGDHTVVNTPLLPVPAEADDGNDFTLSASHQVAA